MSSPSPSVRSFAAAAAFVAAGFGAWLYFRPARTVAPDGPPPVLALSPSPYLNIGPEASYVGSAACLDCHQEEHKSYLRTGMSRSTAAVEAAREPADATFDHAASGRRYKVEHKSGQLWHRELRLGDG